MEKLGEMFPAIGCMALCIIQRKDNGADEISTLSCGGNSDVRYKNKGSCEKDISLVSSQELVASYTIQLYLPASN